LDGKRLRMKKVQSRGGDGTGQGISKKQKRLFLSWGELFCTALLREGREKEPTRETLIRGY